MTHAGRTAGLQDRTGRRRGVAAAVALAVALSGCQTGMKPAMAEGEQNYAIIAAAVPAAEPAPYRLAPGDTLAISVFEEPDLSVPETLIDNGGSISLPLIGDIHAAGLSAGELARSIEGAYAARYLRDPRVSVQIRKGRVQTVAVEGEVEVPGVYPFEPGQTLLTAMALARSPTDSAALDEIIVFRTLDGQRLAGRFDLQAIRAGRMPDVPLLAGDTVVVGLSAARSAFNDALRAVPAIGVFRPYR